MNNIDIKILEQTKRPSSPHKYVGIEFEFIIPQNKLKFFKDKLVEKQLHYYCNLGSDGSIDTKVGFK
jgi:hypothetical protein